MKTQRSLGYALFAGILVLSGLQGCGDDGDDNKKPPVVKPTGGTSNAGGEDNSGGTGNAGNAGAGNSGNEGGTGAQGGAPPEPTGGVGGEGGGPPQLECGDLPLQGADGCFNCPDNGDNEQWFNRCVDSACEPFPNTAARLPLLKADGSLPTLPN